MMKRKSRFDGRQKTLNVRLSSSRWGSRRGGVSMELVIICVLIAVAALVAVIVFGQTYLTNLDVAVRAANGNGVNAGEALSCPKEGYRKQASDNMEEAVKFAREFSDAKE